MDKLKVDLGSYDLFQLINFGNILPVTGREEVENGKQAAEDFSKWTESQADKQNNEIENQYL